MDAKKVNFFRTRREELGLTQRAIAESLGITGATVANWERGDTRPAFERETIERLATVYRVPIDRIVRELNALVLSAA